MANNRGQKTNILIKEFNKLIHFDTFLTYVKSDQFFR